MKPELHHIHKDKLTHFDEILIFTDGGPYIYDFVARSRDLGLVTGKMASADTTVDIAEAVFGLEQAALQASGSTEAFWDIVGGYTVSSQVDHELFNNLLEGHPARMGNPDLDAFAAAADGVARRAIPEETIQVIQKSTFFKSELLTRPVFQKLYQHTTGAGLAQILTYFSSGDKEARRQAALSFPLAIKGMITDPEFVRKTDNREELRPYLAERLKLSAAEMRVYMRFETAFSRLAYASGYDAGALVPLAILGSQENIDHVTSGATAEELMKKVGYRSQSDSAYVSRVAMNAATRIRIDQLPNTNSVQDCIDTISALHVCDISSRHGVITNLGDDPYNRVISKVKAGEWVKAAYKLEGQIQRLSDCNDYLKYLDRSICAAGILHTIRKTQVFDLHRISATADRVLANDDVNNDEALELQEYLRFIDQYKHTVSYRCTGAVGEVGRTASLKTISELNQRWHYNLGQIENVLMNASSNIDWEPLLPGGRLDLGDAVCEEINSSDNMVAQGRKEQHCVGSYVRNVLNPTTDQLTLIYSIKDKDGKILSTAEISGVRSARKDEFTFSCVQHKARGNTTPCLQSIKAADELVRNLNNLPIKDIEDYLVGIECDPRNIRSNLISSINAFGSNICNPDLPEVILENINDVLPKAMRGMSIEDWCDKINENTVHTAFSHNVPPLLEEVAKTVNAYKTRKAEAQEELSI